MGMATEQHAAHDAHRRGHLPRRARRGDVAVADGSERDEYEPRRLEDVVEVWVASYDSFCVVDGAGEGERHEHEEEERDHQWLDRAAQRLRQDRRALVVSDHLEVIDR